MSQQDNGAFATVTDRFPESIAVERPECTSCDYAGAHCAQRDTQSDRSAEKGRIDDNDDVFTSERPSCDVGKGVIAWNGTGRGMTKGSTRFCTIKGQPPCEDCVAGRGCLRVLCKECAFGHGCFNDPACPNSMTIAIKPKSKQCIDDPAWCTTSFGQLQPRDKYECNNPSPWWATQLPPRDAGECHAGECKCRRVTRRPVILPNIEDKGKRKDNDKGITIVNIDTGDTSVVPCQHCEIGAAHHPHLHFENTMKFIHHQTGFAHRGDLFSLTEERGLARLKYEPHPDIYQLWIRAKAAFHAKVRQEVFDIWQQIPRAERPVEGFFYWMLSCVALTIHCSDPIMRIRSTSNETRVKRYQLQHYNCISSGLHCARKALQYPALAAQGFYQKEMENAFRIGCLFNWAQANVEAVAPLICHLRVYKPTAEDVEEEREREQWWQIDNCTKQWLQVCVSMPALFVDIPVPAYVKYTIFY